MNRFFSKLNLSDIKIKAEGNSFPPDADELQEESPVVTESVSETVEETAPVPEIVVETVVDAAPVADVVESVEVEDVVPVASNGHSNWAEVSYEESTALYSVTESSNGHAVKEIVSDGIVIGVGEVLKVSARSRPSAVAGAIAGVVREAGKAEVQAIGAGATNQAIKAVAIARDYLSENGIEAICVPAFIDVTIENEDRTAIRLVVEPR